MDWLTNYILSANPLHFEGRIPRRVRAWCSRRPEIVERVVDSPEHEYRYAAFLRPGWSIDDSMYHVALGRTADELLRDLRDARPCRCDWCLEYREIMAAELRRELADPANYRAVELDRTN